MARPHRFDAPGVVFHITSRGIGARTIFEDAQDWRYFLSLLARCHRRGDFDILAFSIMQNHFHLLIRSRGKTSRGMQRIKSAYAAYFNRTRGRRGPAFEDRFWAKLVADLLYIVILLAYIDENALKAGLARRPEDWRWSSAWLFSRNRVPRWLDPSFVRRWVPAYRDRPVSTEKQRAARDLVVEQFLSDSRPVNIPVSSLLVDPRAAKDWMLERALNADGLRPGGPVLTSEVAADVLATLKAREPHPALFDALNRPLDAWRPVQTFLLREFCGATYRQIALSLQCSEGAVRKMLHRHRELMQRNDTYVAWATKISVTCLEAIYGAYAQLNEDGKRRAFVS